MTTTILTYVSFILKIVIQLLLSMVRFQVRKAELLMGALLIFAILIGACQSGNEPLPDSDPVSVSVTATATQKSLPLPVSPVSPISPVSISKPTLTEVELSEVEFEGCLLFVSNRNDDFEIYKWQHNINDLQQLTDNPGLDIDPAWSSDSKKIAFASNRETDAGFQIYVMDVDGTAQQRVGPVQPGDNSNPSWSPDNDQIVFQSKRDLNASPVDDNHDLYLMDVGGSNIRRLTTNGNDDTEPNWSPDGNQIAFLSERSGQDEVYLMEPDGTNIHQLTELDVLKSDLKWSKDGQYLIFEGGGDLYIINVKTKQVDKLFLFDDANAATPEWGENNNLIFFSSNRTKNWELYILDKTNPEKLKFAQITNSADVNRDPSWFLCNPNP